MIYICIPTHNEQQTVGVVLWKLRQVLTDFPRDYQLLVADDASTDKTPDVLEPYTRVLPLTVIRSGTRQGYAASLELLLREAVRRSEYPKRDAIVTLQADFSDEPDDLVPLIKRLEAGADVAVGNKVSSVREQRARRLARALASWFARRQKWPEGVVTPFDGFRAYRLHAVKRAIEERAGRRLMRYGGWACHAELLGAVLPHARRVDVVDVDDRRDRLQRPTRERAFSAAMQVRAMAAGREPEGLAGVDELDRIAATASRSRERAAARARSSAPRPNGARTRTGRQSAERRDPTRRPSNGAGPDGERGGARQRTQEKSGAGARPGRREPKQEGARRKPRREPAASAEAAPEERLVEAQAAGTAAEPAQEPGERPKRKRRRRRRSGQGSAGAAGETAAVEGAEARVSTTGSDDGAPAGLAAESPDDGAPAGPAVEGADDGASAEEAAEGAGARKRRRRGGRRGGRGRRGRSGPATEQEVAGTPNAAEQESITEAAARAEND